MPDLVTSYVNKVVAWQMSKVLQDNTGESYIGPFTETELTDHKTAIIDYYREVNRVMRRSGRKYTNWSQLSKRHLQN